MEHRNQHWIPRGYLAAWCDPDRAKQNPQRVYRYGKDGRYIDYRHPRQIFSDQDLYTRPDPDGGRDLSTEHALQRVEDAYIKVRNRLLAKRKPLNDEARADLFLFVAALRARSPEMRDHHAASDRAVLRVADDMKATIAAMTPAQRSRMPRNTLGGDSVSIGLDEYRRLASRSFGERLIRDVGIEAQVLGQMQLSILVAPTGGESLITSDAPVVWWDPANPPPAPQRLGLGRLSIEVTLPLSPTMCARVSHAPGEDYIDIGAEAVDELNMRTLYRCREVFISEKPSLCVEWDPLSPG